MGETISQRRSASMADGATPLPTSAPEAGGNESNAPQSSALSGAMMSVAMSYFSTWRRERMANWRPFSEFADSRRVAMPEGVSGLKSRVMSNLPYFFTNYIMVAVGFCLLTLLLAPRLAVLISLPALLYAYLFVWKRDAEWVLPVVGRPVGDREKLIAVGVVFLLVFLYAASELVWIVGVTMILVTSHAILY